MNLVGRQLGSTEGRAAVQPLRCDELSHDLTTEPRGIENDDFWRLATSLDCDHLAHVV